MKRRDFIMLIGGAATWPLSAEAQQPAMPVIGFLISSSLEGYARDLAAFREGLHEADYVEGRNVAIEYRSADNHYDRLPSMAADLVRGQVAVIATASLPAALAAKAATTTIPIVFIMSGDPVQLGLVASLSRSGSNFTGATNLTLEVAPKRLELLHELVPTANVLALLVNPTNPGAEIQLRDLQVAARTLALQLHVLQASTENDIDDALSTLDKLKARGLVIGADASLGDAKLANPLMTKAYYCSLGSANNFNDLSASNLFQSPASPTFLQWAVLPKISSKPPAIVGSKRQEAIWRSHRRAASVLAS